MNGTRQGSGGVCNPPPAPGARQQLQRCLPVLGCNFQVSASTYVLPPSLAVASTNIRGMRVHASKRQHLRRQLAGAHGTPQCDLLLLQEVVFGSDGSISSSDSRAFIEDICPGGRAYFTGHCAIVIGPATNGIKFDVYCSDDGRLIRADYETDGVLRTIACVYAPAAGNVRREFMCTLQHLEKLIDKIHISKSQSGFSQKPGI